MLHSPWDLLGKSKGKKCCHEGDLGVCWGEFVIFLFFLSLVNQKRCLSLETGAEDIEGWYSP